MPKIQKQSNQAKEKLELNEAEIAKIEALAAHGHTQASISEYMGFGERTFRDIKKRDELVAAAYRQGRRNTQDLLVSRLMKHVNDEENSATNLNAVTFYLKTQYKWSVTERPDLSSEIPENPTPIEVAAAAATGLRRGKFNPQEASQVANVATAMLNVQRNSPDTSEAQQKLEAEQRFSNEVVEFNKFYDIVKGIDKIKIAEDK